MRYIRSITNMYFLDIGYRIISYAKNLEMRDKNVI